MTNDNDPNRLDALLEALQASKRQQQAEQLREYRRNWWMKLFPIWQGVNV